jgi:predicted DNA-binding WGR domain protein
VTALTDRQPESIALRRFDNCVGQRIHDSDDVAMSDARASFDPSLQLLVLDRRDATCNMARYYVLSVEPTLFGDSALIREWGRIGSSGRRLSHPHPTKTAACEALENWLARKLARGYRVRP